MFHNISLTMDGKEPVDKCSNLLVDIVDQYFEAASHCSETPKTKNARGKKNTFEVAQVVSQFDDLKQICGTPWPETGKELDLLLQVFQIFQCQILHQEAGTSENVISEK